MAKIINMMVLNVQNKMAETFQVPLMTDDFYASELLRIKEQYLVIMKKFEDLKAQKDPLVAEFRITIEPYEYFEKIMGNPVKKAELGEILLNDNHQSSLFPEGIDYKELRNYYKKLHWAYNKKIRDSVDFDTNVARWRYMYWEDYLKKTWKEVFEIPDDQLVKFKLNAPMELCFRKFFIYLDKNLFAEYPGIQLPFGKLFDEFERFYRRDLVAQGEYSDCISTIRDYFKSETIGILDKSIVNIVGKVVEIFIVSKKTFMKYYFFIGSQDKPKKIQHQCGTIKKADISDDVVLKVYFGGDVKPETMVLESGQDALKLQKFVEKLRIGR